MKKFRTNFVFKVIAVYLCFYLIFPLAGLQTGIYNSFALTGGPSQPEFNSFTPIGTSDMVDLSSGDFNYNIPIMDVGGYPLNLAYNSGITMDQEASWVGLGWNLNVGQINRNVRGLPDDFNGDEMRYEDNMKKNITVGVKGSANMQIAGVELSDGSREILGKFSTGVGIQYNNYTGITINTSLGITYDFHENITAGINLTNSTGNGVTVNPNINIHDKKYLKDKKALLMGNIGIGLGYNSRQGIQNLNLSSSISKGFKKDNYKNISFSGSSNVSFVNNTITPMKKIKVHNKNYNFHISFGPHALLTNPEFGLEAYANFQTFVPKPNEKAYGYEYSYNATKNDILDFNRENDRSFSKNTLALPVTNFTYDLYSINGQGIGGMFRPYKSQVGYVFDKYVSDDSEAFQLGIEAEIGFGGHIGASLVYTTSYAHTGIWNSNVLDKFTKLEDSQLNYEEVYFKRIGENSVDNNYNLYDNLLGNNKSIRLKLKGPRRNKNIDNVFIKKDYASNNQINHIPILINDKLFRDNRVLKNVAIQKLTVKQVNNNSFFKINQSAKKHHTAGYNVVKEDGSKYIYGEALYNIKKKEVSFATEKNGNCLTGLVTYERDEDNVNNSSGIDHYFNSVETPEYAHTYLLTSILSSDYQDINSNGPDDSDLGSYTRFTYTNPENTKYKWRVPVGLHSASFNDGLNTSKHDQKASYIYGKKEQKYISQIETKTHIAKFYLSDRKDGLGVQNEEGKINTNYRLKKLDSIKLFSKPDFIKNAEQATSIKTAVFKYTYDLCPGVPNTTQLSSNEGKLTLKSVYFTYANSMMGKFTPYIFNYDGYKASDGNYINNNYSYGFKDYDIWGNYKPNSGGCSYTDDTTNPEFPFTQQEDRELQNQYSSAWSLTSIDLPSNGRIELEYETDDYQFVQDKKAMKMHKVVGVSKIINGLQTVINTSRLFTPGDNGSDAKYLIIKLPTGVSENEFKTKYLKDLIGGENDKPVFFRFLLNMTQVDYDFVEGYFYIDDNEEPKVFTHNGGSNYGAIPMKFVKLEGGHSGLDVNPISQAGWFFGRKYLNNPVYGFNETVQEENIATIVNKIFSSSPLAMIEQLVNGPNRILRNENSCSSKFKPKKSWIRLYHPGDKLGGGVRIKKLIMLDNWDTMNNISTANDYYAQMYGQQYSYELENGDSSGVATFEPIGCKENPFIEPYFDKKENRTQHEYVEKPFGISFFPSPKVTYSRVEVKNLERKDISNGLIVKTNATGKIVNTFYTTKNFPTKTDFNNLDYSLYRLNAIFAGIGKEKRNLTFSQGFVVETNDMNGKVWQQKVYNEENDLISSVEYKYSSEGNSLNNFLPVIDKDGNISEKEIAVDYDVINDFRENYSETFVVGVNANIDVSPPFIVVPTGYPKSTFHNTILRTAVTTKVVHKSAILKEKIATDLGATVSTENLAWDAVTGQVLITKTKNEYNDAYYSVNYPAYWYYKQMGFASQNLNITGELNVNSQSFSLTNADNYFVEGDQLMVSGTQTTIENVNGIDEQIEQSIIEKLWVAKITGNNLILMDKAGKIVNASGSNASDISFSSDTVDFTILNSGYKNLQSASMASVTLMENPVYDTNGNLKTDIRSITTSGTPKIVNASAIEYTQYWSPQCECLGIPNFVYNYDNENEVVPNNANYTHFASVGFNPYLYNVKGNFRAVKSYAFLKTRSQTDNAPSPRKDGFIQNFTPFYENLSGSSWDINRDNWTFASEVSRYSPYGVELENKDALGRYSSAQYGYNYTLPTAVSSNSKYTDMGYDGFEDYNSNPDCTTTHFSYRKALTNPLQNAEITDKQAHTGRHSIKVKGGTRATLEKRIDDCN